jgi:2-hydroxychromene-2-carboxylate isomerase
MGLSARIRATAIDAFVGERLARTQQRVAGLLDGGLAIYHQLDDPYSHLLLQVLPRLLASAPKLAARVWIIPPAGLDLDPAPELRRRYGLRDGAELAQRFGIDFPNPATTPSAPLVAKAAAVASRVADQSDAIPIIAAIGRALWSGDEEAIDRFASLHGAVDDVEQAWARAAARQRRRGHYQGGMIHFRGGWYWGLDRLDELEDDLRLAGHDVPATSSAGDVPTVGLPDESEPELDLYFSFRSPYAYLALERCGRLAAEHGVQLRIKPVLPMVMRGHAVPLVKRLFIVRDAARQARRHGIEFGRICDPLGGGVERCLALFEHAEREDKALSFCASAARGIWSEALDMRIDDELAEVVRRAGLDWSKARPFLADDSWQGRVERNRLELRSLGLWGVPSYRFGAASYWGQDRLERVAELLTAWSDQRVGAG